MATDAAKLQQFRDNLNSLLVRAPNDAELAKNIDILWEAAQKRGLEELQKVTEKIMGKRGAKIANVIAASIDDISEEGIKKNASALKKIWKRTVGKVWGEAKDDVKTKNPYLVIGAMLSFAGKTWEAVSVFWDEAQKEIPILKYADKPVKAAAIALYIKGAPVLGVIKAAEFVGRASTEYGKTGKFFHSIWKAAKDTAKSIYKHFLRLTIGEEVSPAVEQFSKTLGQKFEADEKSARKLTKLVQSQDIMNYLDTLTPEQATQAAEKIAKFSEEIGETKGVVDLGLVASIVIPSTAIGLDDEKMKDLVNAAIQPDAKKKIDLLSPSIKALAIERIVQAVHNTENPNIAEIMSQSLDAVSLGKNLKVDVNGFGERLKVHNPTLHKKLEGYFDHAKGEKYTLEQISQNLDEGPNLKKLKKSEKKELMKLSADYAVECSLKPSIGESSRSNKAKTWVERHHRKKKNVKYLKKQGAKTHVASVKAYKKAGAKSTSTITGLHQ
jgi:hypothetical protein